MTPPRRIAALRKSFRGFRVVLAALWFLLAGLFSAKAEPYALIFSGGISLYENKWYYVEETQRIWDLLVNQWGYPADNVYVLFSDGTEPAPDYVTYTAALNSDWSKVIAAGSHVTAAVRSEFLETIAIIGERMDAGRDKFFFWSFDHGGQSSPPRKGQGTIETWMTGGVYSSELGLLLNPITNKKPVWEAYVLSECYSGDIAASLGITSKDTNRFAAWSAQWNETSTMAGFAGAWAKGIEAGLVTSHALGNYAINHDAYGPKGEGSEHPGWIGGNIHLANRPAFVVFPDVSGASEVSPRASLSAPGEFNYESVSGGVKITGYHGSGGLVTVPNTIQGAKVVEISVYAFRGCTNITSLIIPITVARIGYQAFEGCTSLASLDIPSSVTSLMFPLFSDCTSLPAISVDPDNPNYSSVDGVLFNKKQSVLWQCPAGRIGPYSVPENVTFIAGEAFAGCALLTELHIPPGITNLNSFAFKGCSGLTNITLPDGILEVDSSAFSGCSRLVSLALPESIRSFGDQVFQDCAALSELTIPYGTTILGKRFLSGCRSLTRVTIPESVKNIDDCSFYECASLTNLLMPHSVTNIGAMAFYSCASLSSITIPRNVLSVALGAFHSCSGLREVTLESNLGRIPSLLFHSCSNLVTVTIPDSVKQVGDGAFSDCTALTNIALPNSITTLGRGTFRGCTALQTIQVPENIVAIGDDTFSGCSQLADVALPAGLLQIGIRTFANCTRLPSFSAPPGLSRLGHFAFQGCEQLTHVSIPASTIEIGKGTFSDCPNLTMVSVDPLNPVFASADGVLYEKSPQRLLATPGGKTGDVEVGEGTVEISNYAFAGCGKLDRIVLPNTLKNIGMRAFRGCGSLQEIVIPDSVLQIGYDAFHDCAGLLAIHLSEGLSDLGEGAFSDCTQLSGVSIPKAVSFMGGAAFHNCTSLTGAYFAGSAPAFGIPEVFKGATNLTVYYRAGAQGWTAAFAGHPTALWTDDPYTQWAINTGLLDQYPDACAEADDPDQDGMSNEQERLAGTIPNNSMSLLAFESQARPEDLSDEDKTPLDVEQHALYFQSVPGKTYVIESADSLDGAWTLETNVLAGATQKRVALQKPDQMRFYRLLLRP